MNCKQCAGFLVLDWRFQSQIANLLNLSVSPMSLRRPKSSTEASTFNSEEATQLFNSLADPDDPEVIGMEGIGNLCDKLSIDPGTDVRILVLMWKLEAKSKPGCINREEFLKGMKKIGKSNIAGLVSLLPTLDPGFLERSEFRG